jgi:hypothetical protein
LHRPLSESRRSSLFLTIFGHFATIQKAAWTFVSSTHSIILSHIWPLISNIQSVHTLFARASEILRVFITIDFYRKTPGFQTELLDQLIASLELIRHDVDTSKPTRTIDLDIWMECQSYIFRNLRLTVSQSEPPNCLVDAGSDGSRAAIFVRLFRHLSYFLDLCGLIAAGCDDPKVQMFSRTASAKNFREKGHPHLSEIVQSFSHIVMRLPQQILHFLFSNFLTLVLPTNQHHVYHKFVYHQFKVASPSNPNSYYHLGFFMTLVNDFDQFMAAGYASGLVELLYTVFRDAFLDHTPPIPPLMDYCGGLSF